MTKELQKFMYQNVLQANSAINAHLGKIVVVTYNRTISPNLPPDQVRIKGVLLKLKPFENINVSGKIIDFVSDRHIIVEIKDTETNKTLFDSSLVVGKNTKVQGDVRVLRKLILGTENIPSKNPHEKLNMSQSTKNLTI